MIRMQIGTLNDTGIARFKDYIESLRKGSLNEPPYELLEGKETSDVVCGAAELESRSFRSRLEVAKYLGENLISLSDPVLGHIGLWAWLSLFFFDELCPPVESGERKPGRDYRYIPSTDFREYYRHLLAGPYRLFRLYGEGARLLLLNSLDEPGDIYEQLASRQDVISIPGVVEAVDMLYFSQKDNSHKRGTTGKRRGNLRRFIALIQQLDLTYDLFSISGKEIVDLLPPEFDFWRAPEQG